jgi:hypothetical protein
MRFNIADAHVSALLMAGRVADAVDVADRAREQAADLPGAAHLLGAAVAGRAALGAGRLDAACSLLENAAVALSASGHAIGWGYRYHFPRSTALAVRGSSAEAAAVLAELDGLRRPFRSLDAERSLARAWVSASEGAVSEAITTLTSAAERAAANGSFAAEVMCLQTATQFGDRSGAARLRELEGLVEGPRVGLAARFAGALRDGDAAELPQRPARRGPRLLDAGGGTGSAMWRRQHPGASSVRRAITAHGTRTRDRHVDGRRTVQPRDRRAPDAFPSHRRKPHLPGHVEDGNHQSRRPLQTATPPLSTAAPRRREIAVARY